MLDVVVRPMRLAEIDAVREVGQKTWSDVASRDVGHKVRYPIRPREIIEAYMWKEPKGCLVAEKDGQVVGSAFCHVWGKIGWVGPFEVLPEMQNLGVGTRLMLESERFLTSRGCSAMGLETMPYLVRNLHFYLRLGYSPAETTFIMEKNRLEARSASSDSEIDGGALEDILPQITSLSARLCKGLDYAGEFEMTVRKGLGRCLVLKKGKVLAAAAIVHSYYPPEETDHSILRLLMVDPRRKDGEAVFREALAAAEGASAGSGRTRLFTRFSSGHSRLYPLLLSAGYRMDGANLRLVKGEWKENDALHVSAWAG
ncbi:MAG: GNAT family N-acetyltransferase [Methanomassiliicoccales archaeon]|jgi:GNAT superfamily N-acetyltransferase